MGKFGKLIKCFVPLLIFLAVSFGAGIILLIPYTFKAYAMGIVDPALLEQYLLNPDITMKISVITEILLLIEAFIGYRFVMKIKFENPAKVFSAKFFIFVVLFFIGCTFITNMLLGIATQIVPDVIADYNELMKKTGLESLTLMSSLLAIVLAPIVEELTFRGMTLRLANRFTDKFYIANIIQALAFGIAHLNPVQSTYAFFVGLLLGYVYKKYNSLYASIVGHMLFNFAGTFGIEFLFGNSEEISNGKIIVVLILSIVAVVAALFIAKGDIKAQIRTELYKEEAAAIYSASNTVKEKVKYVLTDKGYVPLGPDGNLVTEVNAEAKDDGASSQQ